MVGMLKLIRYEFRKNRTTLAVLLSIVVALEVYFLISAKLESDTHMILSMVLIALSGFFVALAVFVLGIASYSRELGQKSSYLIFMTPNSTLSIVASKMLFTLCVGLIFTCLLSVFAYWDFNILRDYFEVWEGYYNIFSAYMQRGGIDLTAIFLSILYYACVVFLSVLASVSVAYLSITLSATFLQNKKGKGLVSFLFYIAIVIGLSQLSRLYEIPAEAFTSPEQTRRMLTPSLIQNGAVTLLCMFGSAWMLKRRVSL